MDVYNCSSIFIVCIFSLWFQEFAATSDGKIKVMAVCHGGHIVNLTNVKLDTSQVASIPTVNCTCSIQPSDTTQSGNVGLEVVSGLENLDRSKFNLKDVTINNAHYRSNPIFINKTEIIYFTKDIQSINNGTRVLIKANFTFNIHCDDNNDRDITRSATSVLQRTVSLKTTTTKNTTTTTAPLMQNDDTSKNFTSKVTIPQFSFGTDTLNKLWETPEFTNTTVGSTDNLPTEMETFSKASDAVKLSTTTVNVQDIPTEELQTTHEPKRLRWLIYIIGTIVGGIIIVGTAVILIVKRKKQQREVKQRDCDNGSIHEMEKDSTYQEISHEDAFSQPENIENVYDTTNNGVLKEDITDHKHIYDHVINTISGRAITDNVYNCFVTLECDNYNAYDISK